MAGIIEMLLKFKIVNFMGCRDTQIHIKLICRTLIDQIYILQILDSDLYDTHTST